MYFSYVTGIVKNVIYEINSTCQDVFDNQSSTARFISSDGSRSISSDANIQSFVTEYYGCYSIQQLLLTDLDAFIKSLDALEM